MQTPAKTFAFQALAFMGITLATVTVYTVVSRPEVPTAHAENVAAPVPNAVPACSFNASYLQDVFCVTPTQCLACYTSPNQDSGAKLDCYKFDGFNKCVFKAPNP